MVTTQNILITGANRGLGLGHAQAFAARGMRVFATARNPADAPDLQALAHKYPGQVTLLAYDAARMDAPAALQATLQDTPLDLLLANAGAFGASPQEFGSTDAQDMLELVRVNALAPLKLVEALAANVARSQRKLIALQSSMMGSITDNRSGGYYAYRVSKAALNMIARGLSQDLRPQGVTVVALHPGWVRTRMGGQSAPLQVQDAVAGQQQVLDRLGPGDTGRFLNYDGSEIPW